MNTKSSPKQKPHCLKKANRRKVHVLPGMALFIIGLIFVYHRYHHVRTVESTSHRPPQRTSEPSPVFQPGDPGYTNPIIREAYAFAFSRHDELSCIPCYCGCDRLGHQSVRDCYIERIEASGRIIPSRHAEFCNICIGIALDTRTLLDRNLSLSEVRNRIDHRYQYFGRPTPTSNACSATFNSSPSPLAEIPSTGREPS